MNSEENKRKQAFLSYYTNKMSKLPSTTYKRMMDLLMRPSYNEDNLMQLINVILTLIKIDNGNRQTTIQYIKTHVNERIHRKIYNYDNIYDILFELIQIQNNRQSNNTRNQNN